MKKYLLIIFSMFFLVGCATSTDVETEPSETNFDIVVSDNQNDIQIPTENIEENQGSFIMSQITREELAANNNAQSCWVAYRGLVYDLTEWLNNHQGGAAAILPNCGTAEQFERAYDQRHGVRESGLLNSPTLGEFFG